MIHEGRLSVVDLAAQLGHAPTMTLNPYAHVIAELRDTPAQPAELTIRQAPSSLASTLDVKTPP